MASDLVWIAKIGEKTHSDNTSKNQRIFDDEFLYKNLQFKLLIDIDIGKVIKGMLHTMLLWYKLFCSLYLC